MAGECTLDENGCPPSAPVQPGGPPNPVTGITNPTTGETDTGAVCAGIIECNIDAAAGTTWSNETFADDYATACSDANFDGIQDFGESYSNECNFPEEDIPEEDYDSEGSSSSSSSSSSGGGFSSSSSGGGGSSSSSSSSSGGYTSEGA